MRSSEHFRFPGKATSTSPSSCWAWCVIPGISTSGFTVLLICGAWLLVVSSVRRISSLFSLSTSISVLALTVCAFRNGVSTLRPGVQVHWPDWWSPVGVANHEKSFCLYFHRILPLGYAMRVKLLFPHQGVVRRSGSNSRGSVWFGSPCFPVSPCFPSGCPVWLCSLLFLCHRKSRPKIRSAPSWLERSRDWK